MDVQNAHETDGFTPPLMSPELPDGELTVKVVGNTIEEAQEGIVVQLVTLPPQTNDARRTQMDTEHRQQATTGKDGRARFTGMSALSQYVVTVTHEKKIYRSKAFSGTDRGGLRLLLSLKKTDQRSVMAPSNENSTFETAKDLSDGVINTTGLRFVTGSHWVFELSEDSIRVLQVLRIFQSEDAIFDPLGPSKKGRAHSTPFRIPLPTSAMRAEIPEALSDMLAYDANTNAMMLKRPILPGLSTLHFFYELPYQGSELSVQQRLPLAMDPSMMVLASPQGRFDNIQIDGPSITGPAEKDSKNPHAKLFPLKALSAGEILNVSFYGLPHRDKRIRNFVLLGALAIASWAFFAAIWAIRKRKTISVSTGDTPIVGSSDDSRE